MWNWFQNQIRSKMKSRMNCYLGLISIVVFSLVLVSSDGMVFGQKSFFDECSNNCTNNGVCKDGNCVCNAGFELPDCSFQCGSVGQFCCIGSSCSSGLVCFKSQQNPTGLCTNYGGLLFFIYFILLCIFFLYLFYFFNYFIILFSIFNFLFFFFSKDIMNMQL